MIRLHQVRFLLALTLLICLSSSLSASAQSYQDGVALYNKGKYKEASAVFDAVIRSRHPDSQGYTYYYAALSHHHMRNYGEAKSYYQAVVNSYPNSPAARLAADALKAFGGSSNSRATAGDGSGESARANAALGQLQSMLNGEERESPSNVLPPMGSVYFERGPGGHLILDATVNGHRMKMMFDTGASGTHFGKNNLAAVGIDVPTGPATGKVMGVGGLTDVWRSTLDIGVGGIHKTLNATVEEHANLEPLLGQDFFKGYKYQIDNAGNRIVFNKIQASSTASANQDTLAAPFTLKGGEMCVMLEHKGRKTKVVFDTGAAGVVLTPSDARTLGIEVPEDAATTHHSGVGAAVHVGKQFIVDELKLGGYIKKDCVVDVADLDVSLLGQPFFSGVRYSIDNENKLIHFR